MGFNLKFKDRKNKSQRQQGLIASDGQGCFEPPSVGSDIFSNQGGGDGSCLKSREEGFYNYGLLTLLNTSGKLFLECKGFSGIQLNQGMALYSKVAYPRTPENRNTLESQGILQNPEAGPEAREHTL